VEFGVTNSFDARKSAGMAHSIEDVDIQPQAQVLRSLRLSDEEFYLALERALDHLDGQPLTSLPPASQISIQVRGQECTLGELARIAVNLGADNCVLVL
jgi:hypothetical protein